MAKRFTDTELYDQEWFLKLPPRLKCAWDVLCRRCDSIGVWHVSMSKLSFEVGETVTLEELQEHFKVDLIEPDKLFIKGFVAFQYGDEAGRLSKKNKFHVSIATKLRARELPEPEWRSMDTECIPNALPMDTECIVDTPPIHPQCSANPQGKGKGRGKGKGKGNSSSQGESEGEFDFESVYQAYPRHEGKGPGLKRIKIQIGADPDKFKSFEAAVSHYADLMSRRGTMPDKIKMFSSFVGNDRDGYPWLEYVQRPRELDGPIRANGRVSPSGAHQRNTSPDQEIQELMNEVIGNVAS